MEKSVIFRDRQELQSADLNNLETFTRAAIDHVVFDAVDAGKAYAGFIASKTSATAVTLTPGRLYSAGAVFARDENVVLDTFNVLPLVTKKRVAIVAWGQSLETDVQPRDFLIDAQTGQTEPQSVAMQSVRYCQVNLVSGVEAADPQNPTTDANVTVLAYVLLSPAGVEKIEQVTETHISNLKSVDGRTGSLELWRALIGSRVDGLATDLASINASIKAFALTTDLLSVNDRLTMVENELRKPRQPVNEFVGFWNDTLLNDYYSDKEFAGFSALVQNGIRVGNAAQSAVTPFTLVNPADPQVKNYSGFILPKFTNVIRIATKAYDGEIDINTAGTYSTQTATQLTRTVRRVQYGRALQSTVRNLAAIGAVPLHNGDAGLRAMFDYQVSNVFMYNEQAYTIDGPTYEKVMAYASKWFGWPNANPFLGLEQMNGNEPVSITPITMVDIPEPYWSATTTSTTVTGSVIAQTFLWSQTSWLSQIGLYFTRVGATGDVTVMVTETNNNAPDLRRVLSKVVVNKDDIKIGQNNPTLVGLPPVLLVAGRSYAVVVISGGVHYMATATADANNLNGTMYRSTDTANTFSPIAGKALNIELYTAKFDSNRVAVEFNAFQLSGGANRIDIKTDWAVPEPTSITFEMFQDGLWKPLQGDAKGASLDSNPAVVRLRAVFNGTIDLMPGMSITPSEVVLYRDATDMNWISKIKSPAIAAKQIRIVADYDGFNSDDNSVALTLLTGTTFATVLTPSTVSTEKLLNGQTQRVYTFSNLTPTVSQYRVKIVGNSTTLAKSFVVANLSGSEFIEV